MRHPEILLSFVLAFGLLLSIGLIQHHAERTAPICAAIVTGSFIDPTPETGGAYIDVRVTGGYFKQGDDILMQGHEATITQIVDLDPRQNFQQWRLTGTDTINPLSWEEERDWTGATITLDTNRETDE